MINTKNKEIKIIKKVEESNNNKKSKVSKENDNDDNNEIQDNMLKIGPISDQLFKTFVLFFLELIEFLF